MCIRILSTGLIIYCIVYNNLHRYRRISFWQNLFALYIYFEKDVLLEDLLTERYPSGRYYILLKYKLTEEFPSDRKSIIQKEFLLSVDSFSEKLMKENFHFNLPERYPVRKFSVSGSSRRIYFCW